MADEGPSFLAQLKQRHVFRVAAMYAVTSWLMLQFGDVTFDPLGFPAWSQKALIILLALGLPIAVVLAWIYDVTPTGVVRTDADSASRLSRGRKFDLVIILALVTALALTALWPDKPAVLDSAPIEVPAVTAISAKSIAVLPFADMSERKDQEYLADGMAEEIINLLAGIPELLVPARTSSFFFKGKATTIPEIARELGVANVLEGSIRRSGDRLRVTVQLVRADNGYHLWSQTYDRELRDVFELQDDIANSVVQALQIKLAGGELSRRKGGTDNLEAYQLYLRAVSARNQNVPRFTDVAREYLEEATEMDPAYGRAWAELAFTFMNKADIGTITPAEGYERARGLAKHALELSPDLVDAHVWLQYIHRAFDWNWPAAEAEGRQAIAMAPMDPLPLAYNGMLSRTLGRWTEAEDQFRAAMEREPLDPFTTWNLGLNYYLAGRYEESEAMYLRTLELAPDFIWARTYLGKTLLAQGRAEEVLEIVQQESDTRWRLVLLPIALQAAGRDIEAKQALDVQIKTWSDTGAYFIAQTYAFRGEQELAIQWLQRAHRQKDICMVELVGEPLFKDLFSDARFTEILRNTNLPTEPVPVNWQ